MSENNQSEFQSIEKINNDIIDIKNLINFIYRNKKIILIASLLGITTGVLKALLTPRVWQGEFQIVLSNERNNGQLANAVGQSPQLARRLGIKINNQSFKTEIEIIKSPSVLMPVFDYAKNLKKGEKIAKNWNFDKWKQNQLSINNLRQTEIVNVIYKDKEKKDIIPLLNKIKSEYTNYSKRDAKTNFKDELNYLDNQIKKYKIKGIESRKIVQEFGEKYNLNLATNNAEIGLNNENLIILNVEKTRVEEEEKITMAKLKLNQLDKLENLDEIFSFGRLLLDEENKIINVISEMITNSVKLQLHYTKNDPLIKKMNDEKLALSKLLKKEIKTKLNTLILDSESKLISIQRPKGVVSKYKELAREAFRDEITLANLENTQSEIKLSQAKALRPWEIITQPTLRDSPIAPKRKFIALQGFLIGIISGAGVSILKESRKNLIYSEKTLQLLFNIPQLEHFSMENIDDWQDGVNLLFMSILKSKDIKKIALITIGEIPEKIIFTFKEKVSSLKLNAKFIFTENLLEAKETDFQLFIASKGTATKEQLLKTKNRLSLVSDNIIGWILLD